MIDKREANAKEPQLGLDKRGPPPSASAIATAPEGLRPERVGAEATATAEGAHGTYWTNNW